MKKKLNQIMAVFCYVMGVLVALYVGGWLMFLNPLCVLIRSVEEGNFNFGVLIGSGMLILLSATIFGLIWCIGYIGFNHFNGQEEPDWEELEKEKKS